MEKDIFDNLIIFEMANNHQGNVEHGIRIIKEMGRLARKHNVRCAVKLQYRNLDTFIHPGYKGRKDIAHIPRFESTRLSYEMFSTLVEIIKKEDMIAMSTPFDEDTVDWCVDQGLDIIKIASCSSLDWPLLDKVAKSKKPIIISTGGRTIEDIDNIYSFFIHRNCNFAFLHCVAEYPAPSEHIQLDFIDKLKKRYSSIAIGYSGHENPDNNFIQMMAIAKGARILERHVGVPNDSISLNKYSLAPSQVDEWLKSIVEARELCKMKNGKKFISEDERLSLTSLQRGIFANRTIRAGEIITASNIYFAMPCADGQMTSGEFYNGLVASRDYAKDEAVYETKEMTDVRYLRSAIHDVKGILLESGIAVGNNIDAEISHHYGIKHFRRTGCTLLNIINREYCKKIIIVLPGQSHPTHYHAIKEETFQLLYGDLKCCINDKTYSMSPGDIMTVMRYDKHSFSSVHGAIFEEVSTTHIKGDSYYDDAEIMKGDYMDRKTVLKEW